MTTVQTETIEFEGVEYVKPRNFVKLIVDGQGRPNAQLSCSKCGGTGAYYGGSFMGRCFRCGGVGMAHGDTVLLKTAAQVAKSDAARVRAAERKANKAEAERNAQISSLPQIFQDLLADTDRLIKAPQFVQDIVGKSTKWSPSPKQAAAVEKWAVQQAERQAETEAKIERGVEAPVGRSAQVLKVLFIKGQESMYGFVTKMTCEVIGGRNAGSRVWLTKPAGADLKAGDFIKLTATWTQSDVDITFGFGKRPASVEVVSQEEASQAAGIITGLVCNTCGSLNALHINGGQYCNECKEG